MKREDFYLLELKHISKSSQHIQVNEHLCKKLLTHIIWINLKVQRKLQSIADDESVWYKVTYTTEIATLQYH